MTPSDADLIRQIRQGDIEAFGVLVDRHSPRLGCYALHLLANRTWLAGSGLALHRDSVLTVAIRDTLALVRFSLIAPRAGRVELVGDFNAWRIGATRLQRDAHGGAWKAQAAMTRGRHRYAFVVDDTQWVADPAAPAALAPNGRRASRVVIPDQD